MGSPLCLGFSTPTHLSFNCGSRYVFDLDVRHKDSRIAFFSKESSLNIPCFITRFSQLTSDQCSDFLLQQKIETLRFLFTVRRNLKKQPKTGGNLLLFSAVVVVPYLPLKSPQILRYGFKSPSQGRKGRKGRKISQIPLYATCATGFLQAEGFFFQLPQKFAASVWVFSLSHQWYQYPTASPKVHTSLARALQRGHRVSRDDRGETVSHLQLPSLAPLSA